jgi:hypothetical protein
MGNNSSSLNSKTSSTNMGNRNDLINKLFEQNNVDSLNMTENNNSRNGGSKIPVIRVSNLTHLGGAKTSLPVANKHSNQFINEMNRNRIFNLIHDTEIQEYHLNNMKNQGILNNQETVIKGGYTAPVNVNVNGNESDVSDAMNRIKEVIVNELKEQELKGGAKNNMSDSNTDACGCGANDDGQGKHSNKCEYGKKKKGSKKGKGYESSYRNKENSSSSSSGSESSSSSSEGGARHSNNGLSVFPFNSSDVSDKNYRLTRRKK